MILEEERPVTGLEERLLHAPQMVGDAVFVGDVGGSRLIEFDAVLDFLAVEPGDDRPGPRHLPIGGAARGGVANVVHLPLTSRTGGIHQRLGEAVEASFVLVGDRIDAGRVVDLHLEPAVKIESAVARGLRIDDELGMEIGVFEGVDRMDMIGMPLGAGDDELIAISLPVGRPAIHPHQPRLDPRPENDNGPGRRLDRQPLLLRREVVAPGRSVACKSAHCRQAEAEHGCANKPDETGRHSIQPPSG